MYVKKTFKNIAYAAVTEETHQTLFRIRLTLGITTTTCSCEASFTDGSLHSPCQHSRFVSLAADCARNPCAVRAHRCWMSYCSGSCAVQLVYLGSVCADVTQNRQAVLCHRPECLAASYSQCRSINHKNKHLITAVCCF